MRRKWNSRWVVIFVVGCLAAAVISVFAIRAAYGPQHAGSGNNPDAFPIIFLNDLSSPVHLSSCGDPPKCTNLDYTDVIGRAGRDVENIGTAVRSTWLVTSGGNDSRLCITLLYKNYVDRPVIPL